MRESKGSNIAMAAFGVILLTFISKFIGFYRDILLGSRFGVTNQTDAYLIALTVPAIIFGSMIGAFSTIFVPIYSSIKITKGEGQAVHFTNKILNILSLVCCIIGILQFVFAKEIMSILARGFDEKTLMLAVSLTKILSPMVIFMGIVQIYISYLQSNEMYISSILINIPNHLIVIVALLLSHIIGIKGLTWATLIGMIAQILILIPFMKKKKYQYEKILDIHDPNIRNMFILVFPVLIGAAVQETHTLIDRMLASSLVKGSISALNFANKLNMFVFGIISMSISTIIYPILSKLNAEKDEHAFNKTIISSCNMVTLFTMPIVVWVIIFNVPIVKLLFQRGNFDAVATRLTASALLFYSIGMLFFGYRDILNRAFYSLQDTKTPMVNGVICIVLHIILNFILVNSMKHNGLALSTSLSAIMTTILLFYNLKRRRINVKWSSFSFVAMKCIVASVIMGVISYKLYYILVSLFMNNSFMWQIMYLGASVIIGIIIYLVIIYLLGVEELHWVIRMLRQRIKVCIKIQ